MNPKCRIYLSHQRTMSSSFATHNCFLFIIIIIIIIIFIIRKLPLQKTVITIKVTILTIMPTRTLAEEMKLEIKI